MLPRMFGLRNRLFFCGGAEAAPCSLEAGCLVLPWLWEHRTELNDSYPMVDMLPLSLHSACTACQTHEEAHRSCFGVGDVLGWALLLGRFVLVRRPRGCFDNQQCRESAAVVPHSPLCCCCCCCWLLGLIWHLYLLDCVLVCSRGGLSVVGPSRCPYIIAYNLL